ncbi:toll-like receptor 1 [Anopheles nili]|uniref:toll-like receptor 1 n=1 Tax=Anopheles nili TaxID=185578 RepID=UPI00237BD9BF|nr:toll-like receptor 1 [Anopheles nili]
MELLSRFLFVVFLHSCGATSNRQCLPGSNIFACILPLFDYEPGKDIPLFNLSADVTSIRFVKPLYNTLETEYVIHIYDAVLHRQLNSPQAIELIGTNVKELEISPNLQYADFSDNNIQLVHVSTEHPPALRYLNLNFNKNLRPANISKLVSLETLVLSRCGFETLPAEVFVNLNRLAHLTLTGNHIKQVELRQLPPSLVLLQLNRNWMRTFDFASARMPLLEQLNIEFNDLNDLNITVLVAIAPKLRFLAVGSNPIKRATLNLILDALNRHNISYYNIELWSEEICDVDERRYRGVCIPSSSFTLEWNDWLDLGLFLCLLLALVVGIAFGVQKLLKKQLLPWQLGAI